MMRRAMNIVLVTLLLAAMPLIASSRRRAVEPPTNLIQPIAVADRYSLAQSATLTVAAPGVLGNDTLGGASIFSYGASSGSEQTTLGQSTPTAQSGTVKLNADGGFTYTPAGGFSGTDTFVYLVKNSAGSSTATVTVVVSPLPVAVNDMFNASKNTVLSISGPGVLGNDTLNGATILSYGASTGAEQTSLGNSTSTAQGGSVTLNAGGDFTYNPAPNFAGNDTFRYTIHNAVGSATGTVTINVMAPTSPGNADFFVTSPGFFYTFEGIADANPELTLVRGRTYTFQINTDAIHPFEILNAPNGAVLNNNTSSGVLTFIVPNTPGTYQYICSIHGFGNTINTTP